MQESFEARYTLPVVETIADTAEEIRRKQERVRALCAERNAILLAHHYQRPEVQEVADAVADSLKLSQAAAKTKADVIVFCGVHFMAETAAILLPDKMVLLPDLRAGCSLAAAITPEELRRWKAKLPGAVVVSYINTSAAVKAESDYCCTSANAAKVVAVDSGGPASAVSAGQIFGGGGGAADGAEQHRRVPGLLPRAQDDSSRASGRDYGPASGYRAAAASRMRLREFVHVEGGGRHAAAGSDIFPLDRRNAAAHRGVEGERVCGGNRARDHAPAQQEIPGQDVLSGESEGGLRVHEDDHARQGDRVARNADATDHACRRRLRAKAKRAIDRMLELA